MKYPKQYLDEIKLKLKVSQVVGRAVKLKRRGKEFIGLSPFTNEKTPSFTVSDEKGFYHCFSSGEHGNIFDFLMKTQSLKFGEAVRRLASEAGMQQYRFTKFDQEKERRYETYKQILKYYSEHHNKILFGKDNSALNYLNKRGIKREHISEFKLGFVPNNSDFFKELEKRFTEKEIIDTGLFYKNEKYNKFINRFRSRIIFPIKNIMGDIIAFGGRVIQNNEKTAKYINSPETEFYKKGKHVFNLDKAKSFNNKDEEVVIVEGYMDVISLYSVGIKNCVSNSGTALTENQINLIWKFFSKPIICLDGDTSGQKATLRIAESLFQYIKENNKISFISLVNGLDPDDYVKQKGKDSFEKLLKNSISIEEFIWKTYLNNLDRTDPFAITKFEKKLRYLCQSIKDDTLKKYIFENFLEKIKDFTPLQKSNKNQFSKSYKVLQETKNISIARDHLTKEEIKEYSILYVMFNYPKIILPRIEIFREIELSSKNLNELKSKLLKLISNQESYKENFKDFSEKYYNLISDINRNSVIKNIFSKKNENEQIELLNEILKELNEIKFSKKIDKLEASLIKNFDEKSFSDLIELKKRINKE